MALLDFILTFFTIGTGNALPTFIWSKTRTMLAPSINAVGVVVFLTTIRSAALAMRVSRFRGRHCVFRRFVAAILLLYAGQAGPVPKWNRTGPGLFLFVPGSCRDPDR